MNPSLPPLSRKGQKLKADQVQLSRTQQAAIDVVELFKGAFEQVKERPVETALPILVVAIVGSIVAGIVVTILSIGFGAAMGLFISAVGHSDFVVFVSQWIGRGFGLFNVVVVFAIGGAGCALVMPFALRIVRGQPYEMDHLKNGVSFIVPAVIAGTLVGVVTNLGTCFLWFQA